MIKNYKLFKESLLDKMIGPVEKDVWKSLGFDRILTKEEYFNYLTDDIKIISPNGLYYEWKKDDKIIFEQYLTPEKIIFMDYEITLKIYETMFDMNFMQFRTFILEMFYKYFKDKIKDLSYYQIRINYKY